MSLLSKNKYHSVQGGAVSRPHPARVRRRPRLLSRKCGLQAAPSPGAQASPPAFKEVRSPGRTLQIAKPPPRSKPKT